MSYCEAEIVGNKLVIGQESCTCMDGKLFASKPCPDCKGTRRGKRGGKNSCKTCFYDGTVIDKTNLITCQRCNGTNRLKMDRYSHVPNTLLNAMPFKVVRDNAPQTFDQAYIGSNCIVSVTDYGRSRGMTDEALVQDVRKTNTFLQALNICDKEMTVCDYIEIRLNTGGYTVKGVWLA